MSTTKTIQFIKSQILKADLLEIDQQLKDTGFKNLSSILLVKQALIAISNLVDFELTVRPSYIVHRNLSEIYSKASKEFEFAKYLRNKFIGHIKPELLEKALEWKPELRYMLKFTDKAEVMFFYNLWLLETAINSYVDQDGTHKTFESETDFVYPPDMERFLIFLAHIIESGIKYLEALSTALEGAIEMADFPQQDFEHWVAASNTEFKFIKK